MGSRKKEIITHFKTHHDQPLIYIYFSIVNPSYVYYTT